jgi:hypothetical protein
MGTLHAIATRLSPVECDGKQGRPAKQRFFFFKESNDYTVIGSNANAIGDGQYRVCTNVYTQVGI